MVGKQIYAIGEAPVGVTVASESDLKRIEKSGMIKVFEVNGVDYELHVISADRNIPELDLYCDTVETEGKTKFVIAVAGLSAKLPAALAARLSIPVFGVPLDEDALRTMIQQPKGADVAVCGAIGEPGLYNVAKFVAKTFAQQYSGTGILFKQFVKKEKEKKPAIFNATLPEPEGEKLEKK